MRIKKIELIGFKSFADPTEVMLGDGVTCIVGPNGCGKSNISDAIRWVFGERSAKLLRGTKMEDVIFSGTEFRKPTGMAEVSITVDNSDHQLPIEYDEVVFSRRLYRSGQSEYFINRTACRLRDILDLILDTGMGSNSYSMIEQGRVDSVIQADPQERRFLIEEAAGISKYKVKKEEALRKLERTEQNLLRIRDIVAEVQKNIQYAERQARRAERYKVQFDDLKKLEIQKAFFDLGEIESQKETEGSRKDQTLQAIKKLEIDLSELSQKHQGQQKLLQEILAEESERSAKCFELKSESRSLAQGQDFNRERIQEFRRRQTEIRKEQELLSQNFDALEKEIQIKLIEREDTAKEHQKAREILLKEEGLFSEEEKLFLEKRTDIEKSKAHLFENAIQLTTVRNEFSRLKTLKEANERNRIRHKETLEKLKAEKSRFEQKQVGYQEEMAEVARGVQEAESQEGQLVKSLSEIKSEGELLTKQIAEKKLKFQGVSSRLKLLQELEEAHHVIEKRVLNSVSEGPLRGKLVKSLREVLTIKKGYESAVEAVLGAFAQGLVAEDVETAQGLMQEMATAHMGPCGIFIQSLMKPNGRAQKKSFSHPGVQHPIEAVVEIHGGLGSLFQPLFENVYVVEDFTPKNLSELLPLAKEVRLVTKQGVLLGPDARIFFRNGRLSPDQGPFQRQSEIKNLTDTCQEMESDIRLMEERKAAAEQELIRLEVDRNSHEEKERDHLVRRHAVDSLLGGLSERIEALDEEIRVLGFEMTESEQEVSQLEVKLQEKEKEITQLQKEEKDCLIRQRQFEDELQDLQRKREAQIHSLTRAKTLLENYEQNLKAVEANECLIRTQMQNARDRTLKLHQEGEDVDRRIRDLLSADVELEKKKGILAEEQEKAESLLTEIRGRKAFQEESVRQLSSQSLEQESQFKTFQSELHEKELKTMDLSYRERSLFERLEQTYNVKLSELNRTDFLKESPDLDSLETEIRALKEKVESFGPVNLLAMEEYEELKHRFDFLSGQEKDLNEARESLLEAIRKINRTTKTLFADTFAKAQVFFQEYYQILFGGGKAELILLEGDDTQEPGVDILVRPPGKKPQHISLLSGGEKALTAMALLFALFKIKPSPLCVLDEVDAPLDEANIDRFLNVLRTFLGSTQFLIVTHNRKTIAMGDFLYGVTMQESGVSKLVSVKVARSETTSSLSPAPEKTQEGVAAA